MGEGEGWGGDEGGVGMGDEGGAHVCRSKECSGQVEEKDIVRRRKHMCYSP